jgi:hypothetical protein
MAGLSWRRIREIPLAASEDGHKLQSARRIQAAAALRQEAEVVEVLGLEEMNQADPILAKGYAAGRLYPEQGLRPYTDIDLFVRPERYDSVVQALRRRRTSDPVWSTDIDLQDQWLDLPGRAWDELYSHSRLVPERGRQIRVLGPEDALRLSCLHFCRHGGSNPVWLCDVGALIENLPSDFDWAYCLKGDRRHAGWMVSVMQLANQLLRATLPVDLGDRVAVPIPSWMMTAVLRRWGHLATFKREQRVPVRTILKTNLRGLPRALVIRWPSPLESVCELSWPIRSYSGMAAQAVVYARRAVTWPARQVAMN